MMWRKLLLAGSCLLANWNGFAVGPAEAQWEQMKLDALNRPRKIIVDDDGCDATNFPGGKAPTIENFYAEMLDKTLGCQIDTITYCPMAVGFLLSTRTEVFETHRDSSWGDMTNIVPVLIDRYDTDPLQLAVEFCRKHGFELFVNMRINDIHDAGLPQWRPQFKTAHPELLCGSAENPPPHAAWTSYDFAQQPVRDKFIEIIAELAGNYAVDGVVLDFYREPMLFKSAAWGEPVSAEERALFTGMIREIRRRTEEIGRADNRPILLAFRLPDSLEVCRSMGLEVEAWMKEGLFDLYFAGGDRAPHWRPWAETAALCRQYGLKFYPSVDHSWIRPRYSDFLRNTAASIDGQTAAAWAGGADGIFYFNFFYETHYFPAFARRAADLLRRDKNYFAVNQPGDRVWGPGLEAAGQFLLLCPGHPVELRSGETRSFRLELGEEAPEAAESIRLKLLTNRHRAPLQVAFDRQSLEPVAADGLINSYAVPPGLLRPGMHELSVTVGEMAPALVTVLAGDELLQGANQVPWRRLYKGNARPGAETIRDGAYRLVDGDENEVVNFLYPLAEGECNPLRVAVECRVEPESGAETAVLRLADGRVAEIISFEPSQIRLVGIGKSVPFETTDHFHRYEAAIEDGILTVEADGELLFREKLTLSGEAAAVRLPESFYRIAEMDVRSILIGSLNRAGTGAAAWKNVQLVQSFRLEDLMLEIKYPVEPPPQLASLAGWDGNWQFEADFKAGRLPAREQLRHDYRPERLTPTADGSGLRLDHNDPERPFQTFSLEEAVWKSGAAGIVVAEWRLRIPAQDPEQFPARFQMILRPPVPGGGARSYEGVFRFEENRLLHPWGVYEFGPEMLRDYHTFRAAVDPASGEGALWIDGGIIAAGRLLAAANRPGCLWGDISSSVDGVAELSAVKFAWLPSADDR